MNHVLYVTKQLEGYVGKQGSIIPFPLNKKYYRPFNKKRKPDRDILYYCPKGKEKTYRLDWIMDYSSLHPKEKITIIGSKSKPADYKINLPNVEVIPCVKDMKRFYPRFKKLIRMTESDGLPRMVDEALMMGLKVNFNGFNISEPTYRHPKEFASQFINVILAS